MLDIELSTIIFTIINFGVTFWILRKLLMKPVGQFLDNRREKVQSDLDQAKEERQQAQKLLEEHQRLLSQGKGEAAKIIEAAVKQADERRQELLSEAEDEVAAMLERAKVEISRQQAKAVDEVRGEISTLSVAIAEKLLSRSVSDEDQDRILDEVLEELEGSYEKFSS